MFHCMSSCARTMFALVLVSLVACSPSPAGSGDSAQRPQAPGERITMSESPDTDVFPQSVIAYGGGQSITLSALDLNRDGSTMTGSVHFEKHQNNECTLVIYVATPDQLLVVYYDAVRSLTVVSPPARNGNNFSVTVDGYKPPSGLISEDSEGIIRFSFPANQFQFYDIGSVKGKTFVFCINGPVTVKQMPGGESFAAISNVVEVETDFAGPKESAASSNEAPTPTRAAPSPVSAATMPAPVSTATQPPTATSTPPRPTSVPPVQLKVTQLALYEGAATHLLWSPDGKRLFIGDYDLHLYDIATLQTTQEIRIETRPGMALSPDGTILASALYEGIKLWDTTGWGELRTLAGSQDSKSVAFSPDGKLLATGTGSTVKLWDAATGKELRTLPGSSGDTVAFSPDGRILAASGGVAGQDIKLWDVASGTELPSLTGHTNWIKSIAFSPDGQTLASASVDNSVRLWDVATGRQVHLLSGHTGQVTSVAFSPDGRLLASASWDLTVKLWEVASGKEVASLTGHAGWITSVAFSPDGEMLASGSGDQMRLWRIEAGVTVEPTPTLSPSASLVTPVPLSERAISPENVGQLSQLQLLESDPVKKIAWSPNGELMAVATYHIYLYEAQTLKHIRVIDSLQWVDSIAFSPDGAMLASASYEGVKLWDTAGWGELRTLAGSQDSKSVAFSPDGKLLATRTGSTVKLWEVGTGVELRTTPAGGPSEVVAFSPDGRILAASGGVAGQDIKLWDVASGTELPSLTGHTNWIKSIAFSPDGQTLASASVDNSVRLWDVATGRQVHLLSGHTGQVTSVAFSPDGRLLASASWDLTVKLWEVASGKEVASLTGHAGWITSIAFSPDGATLASGAQDTARLWGIASK